MAKLRVKEIVKQKGLTMVKVADMLDIHPVNLSTALNGNPTLSTLSRIAEVLEVEVADLFEREDRPSIGGFVKIGTEVVEVSSVADLERALDKAKGLLK
jgi:transcriptional regulator with XRE-family HTH domain